jgi:hypothetical protein
VIDAAENAGIAGFRNRGVLSMHYVSSVYRREHAAQWSHFTDVGSAVRGQRGSALLRALGYEATERSRRSDAVLGGTPRVHALVIPDADALDHAGGGESAATRVLRDAREGAAKAALVVAGGRIRIIPVDAAWLLDDVPTASTFAELDLDVLGPEWSGLLPMLFSYEAHQPNGIFEQLVRESRSDVAGLRRRHRERLCSTIGAAVSRAVSGAFASRSADADPVRHTTLRGFYRAVAGLYAEHSGHYGDLGVRHLGALHEASLAGAPGHERKTSGSHYTPPFVVRRLLENALVPALEKHLDGVARKPPHDRWAAMLAFHVVDPAMGSGHFLVDAVDVIADRFAMFLAENEGLGRVPLAAARAEIADASTGLHDERLGATPTDFDVLRCVVARNCIYGVDLDPLAVELAKLTLWLHISVPAPPSFVGRNLRHGDALLGSIDAHTPIPEALASWEDAFHWPLAFPEVFVRENPGFDVVLGNPPWEELNVDEIGFFAAYIPGIKRVRSRRERERLIARFLAANPDVRERLQAEEARKSELRALVNRGSHGRGKTDLYKLFAERAIALCRSGGALGMVFPRTLVAGKSAAGFRARLFPGAETIVEVATNTGGWLFPDAEPRYTVAALSSVVNGAGLVRASGPALNLYDWSVLPGRRTSWEVDELQRASHGLEVPLISDADAAALFRKMSANGRPFSEPCGAARFVPWIEFNATTDRESGLLRESGTGWPVVKGENFDLWRPEIGKAPFALDPEIGLAALQGTRLRSPVWKSCDPQTLRDRRTLPPCGPHLLFRDASRSNDSRTVRVALVPPNRFAVHLAPAIVRFGGEERDTALRLGIMSSLPFDWLARRRVENHVSFFILNALAVPVQSIHDARAARVADLAARLACVDDRYADFAAACNVPVASLQGIDRDDAIAEIDALVAHLYGLLAVDLDIIFPDFSAAAVPVARREATRARFTRVQESPGYQ